MARKPSPSGLGEGLHRGVSLQNSQLLNLFVYTPLMFEYFLIAAVAFLASFLSFFSGFGLGTILTPVIALFLPLPLAIGVTAIFHFIHNFLKSALLWSTIEWKVVARFGSAAVTAAIPGAFLLKLLSEIGKGRGYSFFGLEAQFSILHFLIGLLLILFATLELFPHKKIRVQNLMLGGFLSGFLGGLSGFQGALRSLFLLNVNLDPKPFIATNAVISLVIDLVRIIIYFFSFWSMFRQVDPPFLASLATAAIGGVVLGMLLIQKVTLIFLQKIVAILLYLFGILLILGIL